MSTTSQFDLPGMSAPATTKTIEVAGSEFAATVTRLRQEGRPVMSVSVVANGRYQLRVTPDPRIHVSHPCPE